MTYLNCYDDTGKVAERVCDILDITEPELIDMLLEEADPDSDLGKAIEQALGQNR